MNHVFLRSSCSSIAIRASHRVDVDNFDDVMRRIAPQLSTPAGDMTFQGLDDFHPDRLYARLDLFKGLRQARANPSSGTDDLSLWLLQLDE